MKTSFAFCKESVCPWTVSVEWVSSLRGSLVFFSLQDKYLTISSSWSQKNPKKKHLIMKRTDHWDTILRDASDFPVLGGRGGVTYSSLEKVLKLAQTSSCRKSYNPKWQQELDKMTTIVPVDLKNLRTTTNASFSVQTTGCFNWTQSWKT